MTRTRLTRREALAAGAAVVGAGLAGIGSASPTGGSLRIATFWSDVTPPLGHPLLAGLAPPVAAVDDALEAHGLVLLGADEPIVLVSVDWLEIRNNAYAEWRQVLAAAAGTTPDRVLVTSIHQHDAPLADLAAEAILRERNLPVSICDPDFHARAVQGVADALRTALDAARPVTHLGLGQAEVREVASNRRYIGPDGRPRFDRSSATKDAYAREQPENTIDPWLKTLSFWDADEPLAAVSAYATHPQSYYRTGRVSSDFPGLARKRRQKDDARVAQIYVSGASGNVTAGKYNDGDPGNRLVLADRLYQAMRSAWEGTERRPLERCGFRAVPLRLEPRDTPGFTVADLERKLAPDASAKDQCLAAMGLSWRRRADAGDRLDIPVLDFGGAQFVLLPAESYVEFQLLAQRLRPDSFVVVAGYGECAPGYIPIERAWEEGDGNLNDWCWVAPGAEQAMTAALKAALSAGS
jgi:hypothetical protein